MTSIDRIYPDYGRLLKADSRSITYDKATFGKWEDGKISLRTCYTRFLKNNELDGRRYRFNEEWFTAWLNSLGYYEGCGYGRETE